jgi:ribonuclease BN (tRNA processing enzyme)
MMTAQSGFDLGRNRLILLGTKGGPNLRPNSPLPTSHALVWNNRLHVIDAGYGVSLRLVQAGLPVQALDRIFITHHHSDHSLELGVLIQNAWLCGLKTPVHVHGPRTTQHLITHTQEAFRFDIETRISDEGRPDIRKMVHVHEYGIASDACEILETDEMRVTALRNVHPPVTDSFALRFDLRAKVLHVRLYSPAIRRGIRPWPNLRRARISWCMKLCTGRALRRLPRATPMHRAFASICLPRIRWRKMSDASPRRPA